MNNKEVINNFYKYLISIDSKITDVKLSEDKWSLREIIGHLIDSASNNHQRFVRLQFSDLLDFPAYEGETWIKTQKYNSMDWELLISLWYNYNSLILNIIKDIDRTKLNNVWVKDEEVAIPLSEIIEHYFKHIELHIDHFNKRLEELNNG